MHLAPNPKSFYRQMFVKGTRIRAEVLYGLTVDGSEPMTPEEVAQSYGLPLAAVEEAITYGAANPVEVQADHDREMQLMQSTGMCESTYPTTAP